MKFETVQKLAISVIILAMLLGIGWFGVVIFVGAHFLSKVW